MYCMYVFMKSEVCPPLKKTGRQFWKDYRIGTLRYNWPMSAHASQAFSTSTVPIRKIYRSFPKALPRKSYNATLSL